MDFINNQYRTIELLKEDKYGCEYLVQDLLKDNMHKRMRVIDYIPETKDFIDYMKINYCDYTNLIYPSILKFYYFNRIREINNKSVVSNRFYYTTEYCEGKNLFHYAIGKDFDELLDITAQICSAFKYVHLRGMLFCNINTEQIYIVDTKGEKQVKITAFPYKKPVIADRLSDDEDLYFKAPEVIQYSRYTKQSDVYLIGVILFHIFTGIAIEGSSFKERIDKAEYEKGSEMDKIIRIVERCTSVDATDRYNSVDHIIDDINNSFHKSFKVVEKKYVQTFPTYSTSLVARENYMSFIAHSVHKYFYEGGKVKTAIITGNFGTGKGAFLNALRNRINQEGKDAVYVNLEQESYQNYYVITELIKNMIKYVDKELIDKYSEDLSKIIPEIIPNGSGYHLLSQGEGSEKHKTTYRLGNFLLETSLKQPFVFMLKDFESMDEASKEVIYYIMRSENKGKIFYVLSFGDEDAENQCLCDFEQMIGKESIAKIQLSDLNIHETADLIKVLLGLEDVPISFVAQLYKETEGNPYKIYESIYYLYQDEQIFVNDKGLWVFDKVDLSKLNLDASADEMLENKINKLETIKRDILNVMSVFNTAVSLDVLESMMEIKLEEIAPLLESMTTTNILSRKMDDWGISYGFNSMTLKKNLYGKLDDFIVYKHHEKASRILEDKFSVENRQNKDELIYQMAKSGRSNEAIDYLIVSAEEVEKKGLIMQAIQFLEQGYKYFPECNICSKKIKICLKLGDLYYKSGELTRALEYYTTAQHNAEENEDKVFIVDSHIKLVKLYYRLNDIKAVLKHSNIAKKHIKGIEYKKGMLELILALSDLMIYRRKYNSHLRIIRKALESIDENDKYYWAMLRTIYGRILTKKNRFEEALPYLEESVEILESLEEYEGLIPALNTIGIIYSDHYYDIEKATEYFEKNLNICQRTNDFSFMSYSYNNLAEMHREKDKFKESLEYYSKALEVIDKTRNNYLEIMIYMNQALVNMELEDYKKCLKYMEKAKAIFENSKDLGEAVQYYNVNQASIFYKIGYFQKAMDYAHKSVDMCISWGRDADLESLYIINMCKAKLYKDIEYEKLMDLSRTLFANRKYKLGRRACHGFAELFIEQEKLDEAKTFLTLSDEYSGNISTKHLESEYEYLSAMVYRGNERKDKLRIISEGRNVFESNEIKWKAYKSLGSELFNQGEYNESLKIFITSLNSLRILIEGVPDEYKIKFLLSHNRHTVKERLVSVAQKITGKEGVLHGSLLLGRGIKDIQKSMDEYFDYKKFKEIIRNDNVSNINSSIYLDKKLLGRFLMDLLDKIGRLGQDTETNMNILIDALMDLTQAKNGFLGVIDEDNDMRMLSSKIKNENCAFYKYIVDQVRQKNQSIIIADVFEYKNKTKDSIIPKDICAVLCIPVTHSGNGEDFTKDRRKNKAANQISGYIYLDTDSIINNFSQETCKLIESVSKLLYLLIENYNLKMISGIDKLTKLYTRKYFEVALQNEIYLSSSSKEEFSLIMLDIDKFKQVNDRFGHQKGDEILQKIAAIVMDNVRKSDVCARYGGEEFIILLPKTSSEGAYKLAEKIRIKIEKAKLLGYNNTVTISLGVATYPIHSSWMKDLIDKADQALYHSKENGRNKTTIFDINMIRNVKRVDKLAGIISGNMVEDQRNVENMLEILELQRNCNLSLEEKVHDFLGKAIEISEADIGYIFILDENKKVSKEISRKNINKKNIDDISYNKHNFQNAIDSMNGEYFIDWTGNVPIDPATGMPNWQSKMLIPIVYGSKLYGVLYLSVALRNREFDANIYNFIKRLSEIISPIFCFGEN
ncbi:MAG: diguanylate cyclase [Lutispora sp.]|nr:diguanylate cyclase [Lutispora sp.]